MTVARNNARGEDVKRLKVLVVRFRPWSPAIQNPDDKAVRGFNHLEMGYLLADPDHNWSDTG